jgi:2-amino-4-hydroxy-6-hydroxymethyldihydropteridine diphosphokinase
MRRLPRNSGPDRAKRNNPVARVDPVKALRLLAIITVMEIALSLGSNIGARLQNLVQAKAHIADLAGITLATASPVYETEPVDIPPEFADVPFLNAVICVETPLAPARLLQLTQDVEQSMGRETNHDRNVPRPMDIDIIYAGDETVTSPALAIPHPRWAERRFVVQPLADIRPNMIVAGQVLGVTDLLLALPPAPKVILFANDW